MLHVHVLLAAPLGAGHMAQPGTDQHEGGIAIREAAHHTGTAADLPVESFNNVIGTDASPIATSIRPASTPEPAGKSICGRASGCILYCKVRETKGKTDKKL